jgi:hypothetical protein
MVAATLISSPASATSISVGSQITLADGPGNNGGGEFYADIQSFGGTVDFITFCLQRNEYFTPGQIEYVGGITGFVEASHDPISPETAYLYTAFSNQTLANYAFTSSVSFGGQTYDRVATATALQMAFWELENEVSRNANGTFKDAYSNTTFAASALTDYYVTLAGNAGWTDIGNVRVLNLFNSYSPLTGYSGNLQDQLVLLNAPATLIATPEPGTLSLLGLGLFGVARLIRRRQRRESKRRQTAPQAVSPSA